MKLGSNTTQGSYTPVHEEVGAALPLNKSLGRGDGCLIAVLEQRGRAALGNEVGHYA